jgi:hypothetical protein
MPTIVSKGLIGHKLDRRYSTPERRWLSLKQLQIPLDAYAATVVGQPPPATGVAVGEQQTFSINTPEATHLRNHWFGPLYPAGGRDQIETDPNNMWAIIQPLTSGTTSATVGSLATLKAADGEVTVTAGLVEALKISLGLVNNDNWQRGDPFTYRYEGMPKFIRKEGTTSATDDVQEAEQDQGTQKRRERMIDVTSLRRNLPVDVYWVCGKFDGFEVQISWNAQQVTVFILTPPVKFGVGDIATYPNDQPLDAALKRATKGMVVVSADLDANDRVVGGKKRLLGMTDGGVTPGPRVAVP